MSITPYGLKSGVVLVAGGVRGYITERQESIATQPSYTILTMRDGYPFHVYAKHNEIQLLAPGVLVGFDLVETETSGGGGPGQPGVEQIHSP